MPYNNNRNNGGNNRNYTNNNKPREKKSNIVLKVDLYAGEKFNDRQYDFASLDDLLSKLEADGIYKMISIPVYMYRDDVNPAKKLKGTTQVGYIRGYADKQLEVSVFATYGDYMNSMEDKIIYPRVSISRNGEVTTIIGLDICSASRYE